MPVLYLFSRKWLFWNWSPYITLFYERAFNMHLKTWAVCSWEEERSNKVTLSLNYLLADDCFLILENQLSWLVVGRLGGCDPEMATRIVTHHWRKKGMPGTIVVCSCLNRIKWWRPSALKDILGQHSSFESKLENLAIGCIYNGGRERRKRRRRGEKGEGKGRRRRRRRRWWWSSVSALRDHGVTLPGNEPSRKGGSALSSFPHYYATRAIM